MADKPLVNLTITQCRPEDDEKFNTWYNEQHIPALIKFKGMTRATRYRQL